MHAALKGTVLNMLPIVIKGIVHPKTHFFEEWVTKELLVLTDFDSRKKYGSPWGPATVWLPTFFKITFMFNRRKKPIQV